MSTRIGTPTPQELEHKSSPRANRSLASAAEAEAERVQLRQASYLGLWIWPSFLLVDFYMAVFLYPAAPIWHFLSMRAFEQALYFIVYRLSVRPSVPVVWVRRAWLAAVQLCAVFIVLMALDFGGLTSSYMHGLSVAMLVIAVVMPVRWQTAARRLAALALMHPLLMAVAAAFSPAVRAQWLDAPTLLAFFSHYVFVLAMVICGALSSHFVWSARQQVYEARKLGRYRLQVPIGEGGMNQVWLAWDAPLRRQVALKILRPDATSGARAVQRFEREARAASKLTSPHTIRIFDFGASDDGIYYIAMEYLRGADLSALVGAHGPMPPPRAIRLALQACESLAEAHEAGIVHRDVKPQNLFVTQAGDSHDFLKLLDFGIARVMEVDNDENLTQTGVTPGTPAFMAPEVCRGGTADARSDIYALGATLYFLLTASPPFVGPSQGHVISAHLLQTPERPSVRRGEPIEGALEEIVLRCLAKDPRDRFQTARDLARALSEAADGAEWTDDDARRFWQVERKEKIGRWEAATVDTMDVNDA